jgi:hypothetical protein
MGANIFQSLVAAPYLWLGGERSHHPPSKISSLKARISHLGLRQMTIHKNKREVREREQLCLHPNAIGLSCSHTVMKNPAWLAEVPVHKHIYAHTRSGAYVLTKEIRKMAKSKIVQTGEEDRGSLIDLPDGDQSM